MIELCLVAAYLIDCDGSQFYCELSGKGSINGGRAREELGGLGGLEG